MSEQEKRQKSHPRTRLQHSFLPTDELGVVAMFVQVASELGFTIVRVDAKFPDFFLKNENGAIVLAEAEYRSSNYRKHGHPAHAGYHIICWEHDDPKCTQPIIELSKLVERPLGMFSDKVTTWLERQVQRGRGEASDSERGGGGGQNG